jgi:tape measure domain-containing protein
VANYNITVKIDPAGASGGGRKVRSELDRIESQVNRLRNAIGRAFAFAGLGLGIRELITLADTYTTIQNRLKTVTDSSAQLAVVQERLFGISQRTRQSYQATAELFTRVSLAAKSLGTSQAEVLQFTESLNKAVILSGASAQEASAGIIQLSQGIASGTLRGDELRSVLEQLPAVADVISKSLGVTRGQLRQMGQDGKITADIVLDAFKKARVELDERFAKTVPTIGQSFQVLQNSATQLIGKFGEGTGVFTGFARAILLVSDNLETLARVGLALAIVIGVQLAQKAIGALITGIRALTAAIAANPLGAIAVAITTVIALLIAFSDQINLGGGSLANLQDFGLAVWESLGKGLRDLWNWAKQYLTPIAELGKRVFGDVSFSITGVLKVAASVIDGVIGFFVGAYAYLKTWVVGIKEILTGKLTTSFKEIGANASAAFTSGFQSYNGAKNLLGGILDRTEQIGAERRAREAKEAADRRAAEAALGQKGTRAPTPGQGLKGLEDRNSIIEREIENLRREGEALKLAGDARKVYDAQIDIEEKVRNALRNANKGLSEEEINRLAKLTTAENARVEAVVRSNLELERQGNILEEAQGPARDYNLTVSALNTLLDQGRISLYDYNKQLLEAQQGLLGQNKVLEDLRGPQLEYLQRLNDINQAHSNGALSLQEYNDQLAQTELNLLRATPTYNFADSFVQQIRIMQLETRNATADMGRMFAGIFGPGGTLSKGIADATAQAIVFGKSFTEGISSVAKTILSQLISAIVEIGVNMLLNAVLGQTLAATALATTAAAATASATLWAPAAALASLATLGANAAPATAAVIGTIAATKAAGLVSAAVPGFADGVVGVTGAGTGTSDSLLARLSEGESVVNAAATRRNKNTLAAMNRGASFDRSGAGGGTQLNVTVERGPGVDVDVEQLSESEVRIIARREAVRAVREEAPKAIAADISNPNGRVSKSLGKNTQAGRRRT